MAYGCCIALVSVIPAPSPTLAPVHTTGVNLDSLIPIIATIVSCCIAVAAYLDSRTRHRQDDMKGEIADAVKQLSDVLLERLETKDNVAALKERISRLEAVRGNRS